MTDSRNSSVDSKDRKRRKEKKDKKEKRDKDDKKKRKKEKHRRHSRSESKKRKRSRSRDKKRHRRSSSNYRFDSPPKDDKKNKWGEEQAGLRTQAPQQQQQQAQPQYGIDTFQKTVQERQGYGDQMSSQLNTQNMLQQLQVVKAQQELATSKADRKIYVGNIPTHITINILTEVLNQALKQMNVNQDPPGDSIVGSWISPDQHYSFVEFRTPEEATRGLNALQAGDIKLYGQAIKLGRPKQYIQQTSAIETSQNTMTVSNGIIGLAEGINNNAQAEEQIKKKDETQELNPLLNKINPLGANYIFQGNTSTSYKLRVLQVPTRVLVLMNLFSEAELLIDEEFDDIFRDVKEECSKFGEVIDLIFNKPEEGQDIQKELGHGNVYCRYSTIDEAKEARRGLHGRLYGNRTVQCIFLNEDKFREKDYSIQFV